MGKISREARLCFIQLWTIADDSGRLRGVSRMLASLLYPYDDDAPNFIDGWLGELVAESCIERYEVDGQHYIQVCNWRSHQKIDKPTASKIPLFGESSRILANPREVSSEDLRIKEGIKDQGEDIKTQKNIKSTIRANQEEKGYKSMQELIPQYLGTLGIDFKAKP
jgi:hypothetical protein